VAEVGGSVKQKTQISQMMHTDRIKETTKSVRKWRRGIKETKQKNM
jgi:hypothetical protein